MNTVTVLFFASLRDRAGSRQIEVPLPEDARIEDLRTEIGQQIPSLQKALETALFAINHEFAFDEDIVPPMAEVAVFPPVSGGSLGKTIVQITEANLDLNAVLADLTDETTGAACIFSGMVRGVTTRDNPHDTVRLEYEAYRPMAEAKMRQVAEEIRQRWPEICHITIIQRVGVLDPKTPTVVIGCSAGHRDTGVFEAARFGIDRLKEIVPIWKKEVSRGGETWVEGDYHPTRSD